jgi:FtsH-binding integral membrane protein
MDDKELWRARMRSIQKAMPRSSKLSAYIKQSQDAAPKWPKWIEYLAGLAGLIFVAFLFGVFGNRPYIVFGAFWLLFAACFLNIRRAAPQFPEFGIFLAWFFLAVMAVFIGYMALHPGK